MTPRLVRAAIKGAAERERRAYEREAAGARWTGALAQSDPRRQPSIDKMLGKKPAGGRMMSAREINSAMQAWARRSG